MLQNHLKQQLPDGWENQFKHHESYPEDYYDVAEFKISGKKKILVLNRNTMDIMEYYYDDIPDNQWIDFGKILKNKIKFIRDSVKNIDKIYFINKNLELLCFGKVRMIKKKSYLRYGYPKFTSTWNSTSFSINFHILVALIFVPNINPNINIIVNHKDCNDVNFDKENLEWTTYSENNKPKNTKTPNRERIIYKLVTPDGFILKQWKGQSEIYKDISGFKVYIREHKPYKGNFIVKEKINDALEDYKSRHPIIDGGWYTNPFITTHKVEANLCGILRIDGKETIGTLNSTQLFYVISINKKKIYVHRLIYETISGKKIDEGNVIDHIQPVRSIKTINNEFSNLREVTVKENNNNTETIKIKSISCCKYDMLGNLIKEYISITEASLDTFPNKKRNSDISGAIVGKFLTIGKYLWCNKNDKSKIDSDLKFIYYKFDKNGNLLDSFSVFNKKLIKDKYLNTGMPAPDGYYYQQGYPNEFLYDPKNKNLIKKREVIKWKPKK